MSKNTNVTKKELIKVPLNKDIFIRLKNVTITTKDSKTGRVKEFYSTNFPDLISNKQGKDINLKVVVSSSETDDTELLHSLFKKTRGK